MSGNAFPTRSHNAIYDPSQIDLARAPQNRIDESRSLLRGRLNPLMEHTPRLASLRAHEVLTHILRRCPRLEGSLSTTPDTRTTAATSTRRKPMSGLREQRLQSATETNQTGVQSSQIPFKLPQVQVQRSEVF